MPDTLTTPTRTLVDVLAAALFDISIEQDRIPTGDELAARLLAPDPDR